MSEFASRAGLNRRDLFRLTAAGFASSCTAGWFQALADRAPDTTAPGAKPKSCILLWMIGGPPQSLTFDPKPHSAIKGRPTAASGVQISEHFPKLAAAMKDVTLLRGMQTADSNHGTARYLMHTGFRKGQNGVNHPVMGSVLAHELAKGGAELPPFVSVGSPKYGGYGPGHLGPKFSPIRVDDPRGGLQDLAPTGSLKEFDERAGFVQELNGEFLESHHSRTAQAHEVAFASAAKLMHSPKTKAFDVSSEPANVRDAYGKGQFGQSVLLARRLIESGVRFVEVRQDGWDVHKDTVNRTKKLSEELDPAFATLMGDLKTRGRLDDTLVICMGEFGRNPANGSSHFSRAWTTVLAGGGLKNGQAIGKTGGSGGTVEARPVSPGDFVATVCKSARGGLHSRLGNEQRPTHSQGRQGLASRRGSVLTTTLPAGDPIMPPPPDRRQPPAGPGQPAQPTPKPPAKAVPAPAAPQPAAKVTPPTPTPPPPPKVVTAQTVPKPGARATPPKLTPPPPPKVAAPPAPPPAEKAVPPQPSPRSTPKVPPVQPSPRPRATSPPVRPRPAAPAPRKNLPVPDVEPDEAPIRLSQPLWWAIVLGVGIGIIACFEFGSALGEQRLARRRMEAQTTVASIKPVDPPSTQREKPKHSPPSALAPPKEPVASISPPMEAGSAPSVKPDEKREPGTATEPPAEVTAPKPTPPIATPSRAAPVEVVEPAKPVDPVVEVRFETDVLPIFKTKCMNCHGEFSQKGGLDLRTLTAIVTGGNSGPGVKAGNAGDSPVWQTIKLGKMPPKNKPQLTADEKKRILTWIANGAK